MKIYRLLGLLSIMIGMFMTSCEQKETPVQLPTQSDAIYASVEMGEDFADQIFYDFETSSIVRTSKINSWELAFETGANERNIFMNGGANVGIYKTGKYNLTEVMTPPEIIDEDWGYDSPSGLSDSTYLDGWAEANGISKNEVYIIKISPSIYKDTFKKIQLISVSSTEYVMLVADLRSKISTKVVVPKDDNYNYAYLSLAEGGSIVNPEPPKKTWDIVFTRYKHIYFELSNFPYVVTGAMINPYNTSAYKDSTIAFHDIDATLATKVKYVNNRDIIGFDWKSYNIDKGRYTVDQSKNYIIKNRNGQYWKLHFLNYYNNIGIKGSPSFEFQRIL
ncbi:MAG: HmuY family protein [Flavipsychrobacter sp.]